MIKKSKIFTTFAAAAASLLLFAAPVLADSGDLSASYKDVEVAKVKDITDLEGAPDVGINEELYNITKGGTYTYYYKFKLSKPGYVKIQSYAQLVEYNFQADMNLQLSTNKNFDEEPIIESWMDGSSNSSKIYKTALEAGTYYIKVTCDIDNSADFLNTKKFDIGIYWQGVAKTGKSSGTSMKSAISIGSSATGLITERTRRQWFKINVPQKSDVIFKTIISKPYEWDWLDCKVDIYNKSGEIIASLSIWGTSANSASRKMIGLNKGTYYIMVSPYRGGTCTVKQSVIIRDKYKPAPPKITSYKKNTNYVSGSGESGTSVTVKYNGKTYKGKVNSKGKFKIKVAKLKSGRKITVTLKDKAGNASSKTVKIK